MSSSLEILPRLREYRDRAVTPSPKNGPRRLPRRTPPLRHPQVLGPPSSPCTEMSRRRTALRAQVDPRQPTRKSSNAKPKSSLANNRHTQPQKNLLRSPPRPHAPSKKSRPKSAPASPTRRKSSATARQTLDADRDRRGELAASLRKARLTTSTWPNLAPGVNTAPALELLAGRRSSASRRRELTQDD